ncbi:MAG: 50S ribosomal protein L6 [Succinivibrionaceae bacterium]|nr:50S ribosomal protein L6 [Succinivibrionaceae bacterium]
MSRVAKAPVSIPAGVEVKVDGQTVTVKSKSATLTRVIHNDVAVTLENNEVKFAPKSATASAEAQAGTARALVNSMVKGAEKPYERKLVLVGVGYRAQIKGQELNLALGYSHPVVHKIPEGVTCECPSQTEIVLKCANKEILGQLAANIRAYRAPEPYKGKGIRYDNEHVRIKETKKK